MADDTVEALRAMLVIRGVEERIMSALTEGLVSGSTHLCIGQEAIPVGACAALRDDDPVIATYRGHGWALAHGVPPEDLFAEVLGRASRLNGGRAGSAYLSAPAHHFYGENSIVGAGVPVALGLGMACRRAGDGRLPLVSIGDGAMNQGNVHEALNMASVLHVPLIVVVENNGYAEMTPSDLLTAAPAARRAAAYAMAGLEVDGNDPAAVHETIALARRTALETSAPVLVEAFTHRLAGHYSGDAQAYRPPGELAEKRAGDPVLRLEDRLDAEVVATTRAAAAQTVAAAFDRALATPAPVGEGARDHVYAH
jgi:TPP-dependent pyruvate/acetoin dehydrogenase alpha subunit